MKIALLYLAILDLLLSPVAFAAKTGTTKSVIEDDSNTWVQGINGFIDQSAKMYQGYLQQQQMQQAQAGLAAQLQIKPLRAMYFPQCMISQAETNAPVDACEPIPVDPNNEAKSQYDVAIADQIVRIAEQYDGFYNQLLSDAQNTTTPVGIKCIKDSQRKELNGMQKKLDYLTNLITQVNQMDKRTKAEIQMMKKDMDDLNFELSGGTKTKSEKQKSVDLYSKYFNNPACRSVVPGNVFDSGNGVRGVKDFIGKGGGAAGKSLKDVSSDILAKEGTLRNQVTTQIARAQKKIAEYGIEDWANGGSLSELTRGGLTTFAGVEEAIKAEIATIGQAQKRASEYLSKSVGYTLPPLDKNFSNNVGAFAKDATSYFKKRSVEKCIKGDLGLSYDQLIALIAPSGQGTRKNVQGGLREILSQDGFISEKMDSIAALDKRYGLDKVSFTLKKGGEQKIYTPYTYFKEMVDLCNQEYEDDKTFSSSGDSRESDQQKVKQAQAYINEILSLEKSFSSRLAQAIQDEVVNCTDSPIDAGGCDGASMSTESKDFCIGKAVTCAGNVQQCARHTENVYNTIRGQLENKVKAYNTKVANMVAEKNKLLNSEAFKAVFNSEWYGKYFNNSPYKLPDNLVVSMPELAMSEYGFMTHGGDRLDFLDEENPENLSAQLLKLKEMISGQFEETQKVVGEYIAAQEAAMKKNQEKWSAIKEKCKKAKKDYAVAAQQFNNEQQKQAAEVGQETSTWCRRYSSRPVCGGTNSPSALMEDALKISSYINPDALKALADAEKTCLESSEDDSSDDEADNKYALVVGECKSTRKDKKLKDILGDSIDGVIDDPEFLLTEINDQLDDTDEEITEQELTKYLKGGDPSKNLEGLLKRTTGTRFAISIHNASLAAKEAESTITCKSLDEEIEKACKGDKETCLSSEKRKIEEELPSSSNSEVMKSILAINGDMESFEAARKKYVKFAKSRAQTGEDADWPDCVATNNSKRVGENSLGMSADKAFEHMQRVMSE